jgi:hypothetical protein
MRARLLVVVAVVFLLVCAAAWAAHRAAEAARSLVAYQAVRGQPWVELGRETTTFDLRGAQRLTIENRFGNVEVTPGGPGLEVKATKYAQSEDLAQARRQAEGLRPSASPQGERGLKITVGPASAAMGIRVDLAVLAPTSVDLTVRVSAGEVKISGMQAAVAVESKAGDVTIANCPGPVRVGSLAGNTQVSSTRKELSVEVGAGEMVLEDIRGPVRARGRVGQICLNGVQSDRITAALDCGEIAIEMNKPFSGKLAARTRIGNTSIALRPGSRCRVLTSVGIGSVEDGLPARVLSRTGPGVIEASAGMGEVTLTEAD